MTDASAPPAQQAPPPGPPPAPSGSTPAYAPQGSERVDDLAAKVRDLKVPNQTTAVEQRILWAAIALTVIGMIAIWLGYWNSSGTKYTYQTIPPILSGGIFGVALVVIGAVLFARWSLATLFRFWLARTLAEQQQQTDRLVDAVTALEQAINTNTAVTARLAGPEDRPVGGRLQAGKGKGK